MANTDDTLITVAIHTYEKALVLRSLLENEGIPVVFNNVNLVQPMVSSGVRVRIRQSDLPLALRIIENAEIFSVPAQKVETRDILVPIDFSDHSFAASVVAFRLAAKHKCGIAFLHTYIDPYVSGNVQFNNTLSLELSISDTRKRQDIKRFADEAMNRFVERLKDMIRHGELPPVKFTTSIEEGVPEDSIISYSKEHQPLFLVMGTRGARKKELEMIGSVTAQVLDESRYSVITIPENYDYRNAPEIKNIVVFCNLDQDDILALDTLHRILPDANANVTLVCVPAKRRFFDRQTSSRHQADQILDYCHKNYSGFNFTMRDVNIDRLAEEYAEIEESVDINLIVVPNKKKNVFSRFFNPGIAHRILFHADVPMLVIPV